jgi:hypothetical protein
MPVVRRAVVSALLLACAGLPGWPGNVQARPQDAALRVVLPMLHPSAREHARYFPRLLQLALDKTSATDGPYEIVHYDRELTSPRQAMEIKQGGVVDVMWDGTNRQRETDLLPIRISLLQELNDYRVFLIRHGDAPKFAHIRSLDQLRKLKAGAGVNWPSTDILRANGLPVVTSIGYEYLFPMLRVGRFDYMPRGAHEAWSELQQHADDGFEVEPTIFLHYRVPYYFFVSRTRPQLAARIERGLKMAQKDGSFDALFNSIPAFQRGMAEITAKKRRVFELKVP